MLARHFVQKHAKHCKVKPRPISREALSCMANYDWPGNVRELENCLQRACAMNSGPEVQVLDLPNAIHGVNIHAVSEGEGSSKIVPISEMEKKTILNTITQLNGDKLLAARLLGIGKTTLYRKLKEYGSPA